MIRTTPALTALLALFIVDPGPASSAAALAGGGVDCRIVAQDQEATPEEEKAAPEVSPVPASACGALSQVLEYIESRSDDNVQFQVLSAASDTVLYQLEGKDRVDVRLQLRVSAGDALRATEGFVAMRAALLEQPWSGGFDYQETRGFDGGIDVPGVRIFVDSDPVQASDLTGAAAPEVEVVIRRAARDDSKAIGKVNLNISKRITGKTWKDERYRVTPDGRSLGFDRATIFGFMERIEAADTSLRVSGVDLSPVKEGNQWRMSFEVTRRRTQ